MPRAVVLPKRPTSSDRDGVAPAAGPTAAAAATATAEKSPANSTFSSSSQSIAKTSIDRNNGDVSKTAQLNTRENPKQRKYRGNIFTVWDQNYQAVVAFRQRYGHIQIPRRYKPHPDSCDLHSWVGRQKNMFRDGKLSLQCMHKLKVIGVEFPHLTVNTNTALSQHGNSGAGGKKRKRITENSTATVAPASSTEQNGPNSNSKNIANRAGLVDSTFHYEHSNFKTIDEARSHLARAEAAAHEWESRIDAGDSDANATKNSYGRSKNKYVIEDAIQMVVKRGLTPMEALRATLFPCSPVNFYRRLEALRKMGLVWGKDSSVPIAEQPTSFRGGSLLASLRQPHTTAPPQSSSSIVRNMMAAETRKSHKEARYLRAFHEGLGILLCHDPEKLGPYHKKKLSLRSLCAYVNNEHKCYTGRKVMIVELGQAWANELKKPPGKRVWTKAFPKVKTIPDDLLYIIGWKRKNENNKEEEPEVEENDDGNDSSKDESDTALSKSIAAVDDLDLALSAIGESHKIQVNEEEDADADANPASSLPPKKKGKHRRSSYEVARDRQKEIELQEEKESRYKKAFIEALELWKDPNRPKKLSNIQLVANLNEKHGCFPERRVHIRTLNNALRKGLTEPPRKGKKNLDIPNKVSALFFLHSCILHKRNRVDKHQWNKNILKSLWTSLVKGSVYEEKVKFSWFETYMKQRHTVMFYFSLTDKMQPIKEGIISSDLGELVAQYHLQKAKVSALGLNVNNFQADTEEDFVDELKPPPKIAVNTAKSKHDVSMDIRELALAKKEKEVRLARYKIALKEAKSQWLDENDTEPLSNICDRVNKKYLQPGDKLVCLTTVRTAITKNYDGPQKKGTPSKVPDVLLDLLNCHAQLAEFASVSLDLSQMRSKLINSITGTKFENEFKVDTALLRFRKKYPETVLLMSEGRDELNEMDQSAFESFKGDYMKLRGKVAEVGFQVDTFDLRIDQLVFNEEANGHENTHNDLASEQGCDYAEVGDGDLNEDY